MNSNPVLGTPGEFEIHVSDMILFKRCRRKWGFQSPLRQNLGYTFDGAPTNKHLYFGTAIHYALEDFHGFNVYGSPILAFEAFCWATRHNRPEEHQELRFLGDAILSHYGEWTKKRDDVRTWWYDFNGDGEPEPAVEVKFHVPLFEEPNVTFSGTFDRIVLDPHNRFWIVDYKTAQRFQTSKLPNDPQVTRYMYAFRKLFGVDAEGVIYIQLLKSAPSLPAELADGTFSCNKAQNTTYSLYRAALIAKYGNVRGNIPRKNLEFAKWLQDQETAEGDKFIRRDLVRRGSDQIDSEEWKIYAETREMLDPELPLYPNQDRNCSWDCDFQAPCLAMDDGSDWKQILSLGYTPKPEERDIWRNQLPNPDQLLQIRRGLPAISETEQELLFKPPSTPPAPLQLELLHSTSSTPFVESDT